MLHFGNIWFINKFNFHSGAFKQKQSDELGNIWKNKKGESFANLFSLYDTCFSYNTCSLCGEVVCLSLSRKNC